jgi:hypothetical protein
VSVNVKNMRTWVRRLRDPESRQARGRLRREDGLMCCLGHACDASGLGVWDTDCYVVGARLSYATILPPDVVEWLGLDEADPLLLSKFGRPTHAASLNDVHGYTLAEIADCIERTWPEVREEEAS